MTIKYIDQMNLEGKTVLIRVDYNVPLNKELGITDDTRIKATLPTINYCLEKNAKIILMSHLGRPKGKKIPEKSLKPAADRLSKILSKNVKFITEDIDQVKEITDSLNPGEIALLENLRFYSEEEKNNSDFGKKLANLADVYINDAFATAHRSHASNEAVTHFIKEKAAGFLLKNEIEYFNKAMKSPRHPFGTIIGGAKISSKLEAIKNIINKVDFLIIGGGMAFTFLKAQGYNIGKSLLEEELIETAKEIMDLAKKKNVDFLLPKDVLGAKEFENNSPSKNYKIDKIPNDIMGLDIGQETIDFFSSKIKSSKTIIWNGPMGAFEMDNFATGTNKIAEVIGNNDILSIVGGGDSVTAIHKAGIADKFSYISTGGGAFLELLEGKTLPGLAALNN